MKYESAILKRLIDTYGVVGNPKYISEIIKEFIVRGKECFPNLFTYQSDWLAHIDEFGLSPTYTVSYTGQSFYAPNTLEKPVKSAILKGNTSYKVTQYSFLVGKYLNVSNGSLNVGTSYHLYCEDYFLIPKGTQITLRGNNNYKKICYYDVNKNFISGEGLSTDLLTDFTTVIPSNAKYFRFNTSKTNITSSIDDYLKIYIDDDLYLSNEEYIQEQELISVKMPVLTTVGKNLFNKTKVKYNTGINMNGIEFTDSNANNYVSSDFIEVKENTFYYIQGMPVVMTYDKNKEFLKIARNASTNGSFTTPNGCKYIRIRNWKLLDMLELQKEIVNITQLEEGSIATSYEPYKSNILTVNEDVELRGIGDVKDELNLLTGEISNNFNKITIDGTEKWYKSSNETELTVRYRCDNIGVSILKENICICDSYNVGGNTVGDDLVVAFSGTMLTYRVLKSKFPTLEDFKKWLNDNPHTFIYQTEKSIKTVDLTILDQNGQTVKQLLSFNGGTHFNTGSLEGSPLPTVNVSVETDLEKTLAVCSLEGNTV